MAFVNVNEYTVTGFDALRKSQRVIVMNSAGIILALQRSDMSIKVGFDSGCWGWYPCEDVEVWAD